jgi:hypothetical protein
MRKRSSGFTLIELLVVDRDSCDTGSDTLSRICASSGARSFDTVHQQLASVGDGSAALCSGL